MFDREYTLVAHPRVRLRVAYRSDEGETTALSCSLDYRRDGTWTEEGAQVALPEHPEEGGVEWQGLHFALYRDGERVLASESSSGVLGEVVDAVEALDRYAPAVTRKGRELAGKAVERRPRVGGGVEMTQTDGTAIRALEPPAQASFEVYRDGDEKWRWRLVHDNGNVIADSGQGYASKRGAKNGVRSVKRNALGAATDVEGENESESPATETESGTEGTAES